MYGVFLALTALFAVLAYVAQWDAVRRNAVEIGAFHPRTQLFLGLMVVALVCLVIAAALR